MDFAVDTVAEATTEPGAVNVTGGATTATGTKDATFVPFPS